MAAVEAGCSSSVSRRRKSSRSRSFSFWLLCLARGTASFYHKVVSSFATSQRVMESKGRKKPSNPLTTPWPARV